MRKWLAVAALISLPCDQQAMVPTGDRVAKWSLDLANFGGFSAIELTVDGLDFLALTDQGMVFPGTFIRQSGGQIAEILSDSPVRLADETGRPLKRRRDDTEGLALRDDGSFLVSTEGKAEILAYSTLGAAAQVLPRRAQWDQLDRNSGLEALGFDALGHVLTLPENPEDGHYSLQIYDDTGWSDHRLVAAGTGFRAVALDLGPDNQLYLLERRFVFPGGFASRLQRLDDGGPVGEVIWSSPPGRHGNLEGLSVWRDPIRGLIGTMISDDNFLGLLQTQIIEIVIDD